MGVEKKILKEIIHFDRTAVIIPIFRTGELQFFSYQTGETKQEIMECTDQGIRKYKRSSEEMLDDNFKALEPK